MERDPVLEHTSKEMNQTHSHMAGSTHPPLLSSTTAVNDVTLAGSLDSQTSWFWVAAIDDDLNPWLPACSTLATPGVMHKPAF